MDRSSGKRFESLTCERLQGARSATSYPRQPHGIAPVAQSASGTQLAGTANAHTQWNSKFRTPHVQHAIHVRALRPANMS
eukprot:10328957-Heterocapsa_arctica.AAC.1